MQIRSFKEYKNFTEYSQKVNDAITNINRCTLSKETKQMSSFKVTLDGLKSIMNDMKETKRLLDNIASLPVMDLEAKKDNKNAQKVAKIISNIKKRLKTSYEKQQEEFLKQFKAARKQLQNASQSLEKEDKVKITNASMNFRLMAEEAKMSPHKIPFNKKDEMTTEKIRQTTSAHEQKSGQLNNSYKVLDNTDNLEQAVARLAEALAFAPNNKTTNAVSRELNGIKARKPKMIAVAKTTLDQLRHSQQLLLDIEDINQIMGANPRFLGNDKKLQQVATQIEKLHSLLERSKKEEETRYAELKDKSETASNTVSYATQAVQKYTGIIETKQELPKEYTNMKARLTKMSNLLEKSDPKKGVTR